MFRIVCYLLSVLIGFWSGKQVGHAVIKPWKKRKLGTSETLHEYSMHIAVILRFTGKCDDCSCSLTKWKKMRSLVNSVSGKGRWFNDEESMQWWTFSEVNVVTACLLSLVSMSVEGLLTLQKVKMKKFPQLRLRCLIKIELGLQISIWMIHLYILQKILSIYHCFCWLLSFSKHVFR